MAKEDAGATSGASTAVAAPVAEPSASRTGEDVADDQDALRSTIDRASRSTQGRMAQEDQQAAFDWFMEGYDEQETVEPHYPCEINVSTEVDQPKMVTWWVKPLQSEQMDSLRRLCQLAPNREQRRRGETELDLARFNAFLVFEGTVNPDLKKAAQVKQQMDGSVLVRHRFRFKPLLVEQIAGEILRVSGGDDEDFRRKKEIDAGKTS